MYQIGINKGIIPDSLSIHHQELKTAYTATVYVKYLLLRAAILSPIAARSSSCLTYTVVVYGFELLMMDGKTVRNT